jgi:hypothetical protein
MACSVEDRGRSRRPDADDQGWSHRSGTRWPGGREVGWRRVRSAPGTWRLEARVSWLSLKTKWASVCRLRHKTDGRRSAQDTRRDLAACLASKQVWLGFPSLA